MSKCRHCGRACPDHAVYCEECLSAWSSPEEPGAHSASTQAESAFITMPDITGEITLPEIDPFAPDPEYATHFSAEETVPPVSPATDTSSHMVDNLSDAARQLQATERKEPRLRRSSRLSPFKEISVDVERESTPHPSVGQAAQNEATQPAGVGTLANTASPEKAAARRDILENSLPLPDFWPWLPEHENEENEDDKWADAGDPLLARQLDPAAAQRIEQEDVRRAIAEGHIPSFPMPKLVTPLLQNKQRLRLFFICAAALILLSLAFDSLLVSFSFLGSRNNNQGSGGIPTLTLSTPTASYGENITLSIRHFRPHAMLYLTHDIGEPIRINIDRTLVAVGDDGSVDVKVNIDTSWEPGFHLIQAEDINTRYIASTTLHVTEGPTRPSHFLLDTKQLDMGGAYQGANTLQPLTLHNSGSGNISWTVSSDQSWLQVTPTQGAFSSQQTLLIGIQRTDLKPGSYTGTLTFASNVGEPQTARVTMEVRALPPYPGAVLQVTPVVLNYSTVDGNGGSSPQALMITNPGTKPLYWTISGNQPVDNGQNAYLRELDPHFNWLKTRQDTGIVAPHDTSTVPLDIDSSKLLAGTYLNTLSFSASDGHTAINSPQSVAVALTVKPQCTVTASTPAMSFVTVAGLNHPSDQTLFLKSGTNCPGTIGWHASSLNNWISITPNSGTVNNMTGATVAIGVNPHNLNAGHYTGLVSVVAGNSSLSMSVDLSVQAPPTPTAPILSASPLSLNFSTTQGKGIPAGQAVTLTNTGHSPLSWRTNINNLAYSWLGTSPTGSTIAPGQTGQVIINIDPSNLSPGTYVGQVVINGSDNANHAAPGSPQTIIVTLTVAPPCTLAQPSQSALAFNAIQGGSTPTAQTITLSASGNCSWPLTWNASISGNASWLALSANKGTFTASNAAAMLNVSPSIAGLDPGVYRAQVNIDATESTNTSAQGSPQSFTVTLTVQPPCSLQVAPDSLSFTGSQNQTIASQNISLQTTGTCVRPVSWTASIDSGSSGWLSTGGNGSDTGSGSTLAVTTSPGSLPPGTYRGTITLSASGSGGSNVVGSPVQIPVTLTITGYKLSGSAVACADSQCATPAPLPNATITLSTSSGVIATTTADSSGNFSFSNIPIGSYTLAVSGANAQNVRYTGSMAVTINSDTSGMTVQAPPATTP